MITLLLALIVIGFVLFLFNRFVTIDENVKALINYIVWFVIAIVVILMLLRMFGFDVPTPKLN